VLLRIGLLPVSFPVVVCYVLSCLKTVALTAAFSFVFLSCCASSYTILFKTVV
jgi:hypothetical protein